MLEREKDRGENVAFVCDNLERLLLNIWQEVLESDVNLHDNFFAAGGNSIKATLIMNRLQQQTNFIFHPVSIFDAPTIAELTAYLQKNYPQVFLDQADEMPPEFSATPKLREPQIEQARDYLARRLSAQTVVADERGAKNRQAIFILSPPRSGSTLLRVMLGGHPQLFSPPELYLLSFNTLQERQKAFSGRLAFLNEGLIRAIMALKDCTPAEAEATLAAFEAQDLRTKDLYRWLQSWLDARILVDKTPPYAFNPAVLNRMEAEFDNAHYIHLVRHPAGMVHSFEAARVDLAAGDDQIEFAVSPRQKGELWWLIGQQNIQAFLDRIPAHRQHRVQFEALLKTPEATVKRLCSALGIEFYPAMLQPYAEKTRRMTDGVHDLSRLIGDPKFHTHQGITASVADQWREVYTEDFLCEKTWAMAEALGYASDEFMADREADDEREVWEF